MAPMAGGREGKRAAFRVLPAKTCFPVDGVNVSACSMGDDDDGE